MRIPKVRYFLPEFEKALREQLTSDDIRWGDTWLKRGRNGQEERFVLWMKSKIKKYEEDKEPIPWLKIAGEAVINFTRENHPELSAFADKIVVQPAPEILEAKHETLKEFFDNFPDDVPETPVDEGDK